MTDVAGSAVDEISTKPRTAEQLWHEYYSGLAGWAAGMTSDPELGREIAAEAFTRLLAKWRRVENPKGFLYVVATNLIRDHWRREARRRRATNQLLAERGDHPAGPDTSIRDVVDRLPEKFRTPVLLHYYADLTVAAVARSLGRPEGTVKRELSEARALLHKALEENR